MLILTTSENGSVDDKLSKREITDRLRAIDLERVALDEEERMLRELLSEWPDDAIDLLDSEPPDTDRAGPAPSTGPPTRPETPTSRSSGSMRAVTRPCDACGGTGSGPFGDCAECAGSGAKHPNRS